MRDPHVVSLTYQLVPSERTSFVENVEPIEDENDAFSMRLDDGVVTFEMHQHHASEASARQAVEPYLRAWEIDHALWAGSPEIRFEFERSKVIDRDPPKPGEDVTVVVPAAGELALTGMMGGTASMTRGSYPRPPSNFAFDTNVEILWERWQRYRQGREPLASMGNFCKTLIQALGGGDALGISRKVVRKLGVLTSTAGGRKADALRPFTSEEQAWIEATVLATIRRLGEVAAGASPSRLTMGDLPPL